MFEYKIISTNELEQIIINASQRMGVNEAIIEKDDFSASLRPQFRYSRPSIRSKRPFAFKTQFRT